MVLSWTKTRVFRRARKGKGLSAADDGGEIDVEVVVPAHFRCPITLELMKDPVTLSTGITYDRDSIEKWLEDSKNRTCCPVTNQPLPNLDIVPNHTIRRMIQDWCVDHRSYGIQRIPTPRIPVTKYQISEVCNKIITATEGRDLDRCQNLVGKLKIWGKESERNKRCIVENGTGVVLANAFHSLSNDDSVFSFNKNVAVLEDILGVLTWACTFPSSQAQTLLGSEACLRAMVWFLNGNNLTSRQNAALVLKQVSFEELSKRAEGINIIEALVKMIKEEASIGASGIKACLRTIFLLVSHGDQKEKMVRKCLDLGLVSLLLELSVDGERGICEKALGVLDCLCESQKGKQEAKENALTLPLVVKKILRVSGLASQFGVSILWKLCLHKKEEEEERVINIMEALQAGAFQKLLVLLQVGCDEITKEKATELLKVMNAFKSRVDCVDSSLDLKYLKK